MDEQAERQWNDWLTLSNHFEHEFQEGEITVTTYEVMIRCLVTFKPKVEIEFEGNLKSGIVFTNNTIGLKTE